jgi:Tol biopolymer transport system component
VTRLTDNDGFDGHPSWSPDGTKIAFSSEGDDVGDGGNDDLSEEDDGNFSDEIYIMNAADGSGVTRLTDNDAIDISTDWGTNASPADGNGTDGNPPTPPTPPS